MKRICNVARHIANDRRQTHLHELYINIDYRIVVSMCIPGVIE